MFHFIYNFSVSDLCRTGISVQVKGEANTCWTTSKQETNERGEHLDESETLTAHEEYFKTKYYLVGSASGKIVPQYMQGWEVTCYL